MTSLSNQQKLFCQKYLELGMNGTQAYLSVYKTCKKEETAMAGASRLLRNVNRRATIESRRKGYSDYRRYSKRAHSYSIY